MTILARLKHLKQEQQRVKVKLDDVKAEGLSPFGMFTGYIFSIAPQKPSFLLLLHFLINESQEQDGKEHQQKLVVMIFGKPRNFSKFTARVCLFINIHQIYEKRSCN